MARTDNILISVEDRYVRRMLRGEKKVELRRKALNLVPGTHVWIYSKLPKGEVCALGVVERVAEASPDGIWEEFSEVSGVSEFEFNEYFSGASKGYAIVFEDVFPLGAGLSLSSIRSKVGAFQPPQFFKRLNASGPELSYFQTALSPEYA
ncbi:hypothetical protein [Thalassospira tepidiphila]|jgi:predicted transcriptional regulator|uniref:hypothetical protein n=1 Tax=Thalassospira tepidiphila TaxID=393657 RepID=UPI001BCE19A7|nr:hypothetical protein [Thalassospira tepidiphila]